MTEIEQLPPEIEALALRALSTRVTAHLKMSKVAFDADYQPGDKHTFRSPVDGLKVGQVYRTDPDAEWRVVDRTALTAHLSEFPGCMETVVEIGASEDAVIDALREFAPHLLVEIERVSDSAVKDALEQSKATGSAAAPGIALVQPGGVLTVKPDANADQAIEGLIRAGLLTWDGQRALPAADERRTA